jgi:uncharacterized Ntn-hydrolase superfamily protein
MTYSILARDIVTGQFGVAVQSHFLAVGNKVPGALSGVGAVATQANVRTAYRADGLQMLADGSSAQEALDACLANDPMSEVRQVAMIDADGRTAVHTGAGCWGSASHHAVSGVCAQANTVASLAIPEAMVSVFQSSEGPFALRLLAALDAAEALGGDLRGRQSAAIYIVDGDRSEVEDDVLIDLRVDNDPEPLAKLRIAVGLALAFTPMWNAIRGPACRGPVTPTPDETNEALEVLDVAQREYGPQNSEPTFWRAVALWRASRQKEASQVVADIARDNPGWTLLFDDVVSRWAIPPSSTSIHR